MHSTPHLEELARTIRALILKATTQAGSGHPSSSLSATDLMTALLFGGTFRYDVRRPHHPNNDRLIFSKGHASPLYYALWTVAGAITEDDLLSGYRRFGSPLEGHPTSLFAYADAATGSLGQGLSIGVGMALAGRYLDHLDYRTYVLLGDSEMTEGSQWEAIQIAAHYRLSNLVGILDVNRLGQRGETLHGHHVEAYRDRIAAFGWDTLIVDGHSMTAALEAFRHAASTRNRPLMIIARTTKGKGVPLLEDREGWHGRALDAPQLKEALAALGEVATDGRHGTPAQPADLSPQPFEPAAVPYPDYTLGSRIATREAYGRALARLYAACPSIVCVDAEVCNSTRADLFRDAHPERYFEMFIAEQNMIGVATGLAARGHVPFASTFAAFLTRAFDQIRMAQYAGANLKIVGSHAGVSIGEDGPSQMGLEDLAMMRSIAGSVVFYPCDAMSTERLVELMALHTGIAYLRTTRGTTPVIYGPDEAFEIGGSKVLRRSDADRVTIAAAGITVHEALKAYAELLERQVAVRVIDLYSVKPLDDATLRQAGEDTAAIVTVEDHVPEGGLGEAVTAALAQDLVPVRSLAVRVRPRSGTPAELLEHAGISATAIVSAVEEVLGQMPGEQRGLSPG